MPNNNKKEDENLTPQQQKELNEFIKESIADGSYFKDAKNWYALNFINPLSERTLLLLASITGVIITYMLYVMITDLLPLKHSVPVVIEAKDTAKYIPVIKAIEIKKVEETIDEVVARYLIINYVKEREEHDYREGNIAVYNLKLNKIMNNSSASVFREFKKYMDPSDDKSPIHDFGKNIFREVAVRQLDFISFAEITTKDQKEKKKIPNKARVFFDKIITYNEKSDIEPYIADLSFEFSGVNVDEKNGEFLPLDFVVTEYSYVNK